MAIIVHGIHTRHYTQQDCHPSNTLDGKGQVIRLAFGLLRVHVMYTTLGLARLCAAFVKMVLNMLQG